MNDGDVVRLARRMGALLAKVRDICSDRITAEACLRLKDVVAVPQKVVKEIELSLRKKFAFMATTEDAKAIYAEFRSLKFERFGVETVRDLSAIREELDTWISNKPTLAAGSEPEAPAAEPTKVPRRVLRERAKAARIAAGKAK